MIQIVTKISSKIRRGCFYVLNKNRYGYLGRRAYVDSPLRIEGAKNICIGEATIVNYKAWLGAVPRNPNKPCELIIGRQCSIGHFNEIFATQSIVIEDCVLVADRVYISDNLHGYTNIEQPIIKQPVEQNGTVRIGTGSWIGVGVAILGANIGKHCIIGANSVVTHDIPDYSVAVGAPAKVVKRYNFSTQRWERTNPDSQFINVCPKNIETGHQI